MKLSIYAHGYNTNMKLGKTTARNTTSYLSTTKLEGAQTTTAQNPGPGNSWVLPEWVTWGPGLLENYKSGEAIGSPRIASRGKSVLSEK